jgi:long-subunit acyl-CoA synthetase (AMP-forming)
LGRINPATGDLILTGRAKDTIVLSNGENVEPQPLEDAILGGSGGLVEDIAAARANNRGFIHDLFCMVAGPSLYRNVRVETMNSFHPRHWIYYLVMESRSRPSTTARTTQLSNEQCDKKTPTRRTVSNIHERLFLPYSTKSLQ